MFWNLLTNAVKFTPPGGAVFASARTEQGDAVVSVTDTGQGIDAAFLPFVFDRSAKVAIRRLGVASD